MTDLFFRAIVPDELDDFFAALSVAFSDPRPDPDEVETDKKVAELDRTFAAFEDDRIVGCAGVYTQRMVVPGGAMVPTAGVTMVGVLPTHRRRGILRELMGMMLDQAAERGEAIASLFASQGAIYGRFGFGHAAHHLEFDIALDHLTWADGTEPTGRGHAVSTRRGVAHHAAHLRARDRGRPAALEVNDAWMDVGFWESKKDDERVFYAIHADDAGTPDAFAMYGIKHEWPRGLPSSEAKVKRFVATTPESHVAMWRYLCSIDLDGTGEGGPSAGRRALAVARGRAARAPPAPRGRLVPPARRRRRRVVGAWIRRQRLARGRGRRRVPPRGCGHVPARGGRRRWDLRADRPGTRSAVLGSGRRFDLRRWRTWTTLAGANRASELTPGALAAADGLFRCDRAPWPLFYF
jgi:predicted N-acetyltransferase YhbS